MKKIFGLMILTALFSLNALADIAQPEKPKPVEAEIGIYLDDDATEAKLVISRELIAELAKTDDGAVGRNISFGRTQTLVSGLFLSLALIFGGVWLARSKNSGKGARIALGIGGLAMLGLFSVSVAYGNAAPPLYRRITSKIFSQGMQAEKTAFGQIKIEITDDTSKDFIQLVVPVEKKEKKAPKKE